MCVSLICANVSAPLAAGTVRPSPVAAIARGTPPETVQMTADAVQVARQRNAWRRSTRLAEGSRSCVVMNVPW